YTLGEVCFRNFFAAGLRDSFSDIFHCLCARSRDATALGRRRILVLFVGRGALVDRVPRLAPADCPLRLRTWTYPCALGFADGRARQPVSRQPRRWPCGNEPKQFLDS